MHTNEQKYSCIYMHMQFINIQLIIKYKCLSLINTYNEIINFFKVKRNTLDVYLLF